MGHFTNSGKYFSLSEVAYAPSKTLQIAAPWRREDTKMESAEDVEMEGYSAEAQHAAEVARAGEDFVVGLGVVLSRWVQQASMDEPHKVTHFHSTRVPPVSIGDYLKRLRKYFYCSDECFVMGLAYLDRLTKKSSANIVCDLTVHRLLLIASMIAAKFHDDTYYSNAYYAKVGGLKLKEVNALEAEMLKILDWNVTVPAAEYQLYHSLVCDATGRS